MADAPTDDGTEMFDAVPQEITDHMSGDIDGDINLDLLLDVPVNLAIEIGRTRLSIGELMKLTPG
ncbi:MAG: FliM/FliN family flagellar motor switch protein, partial [Pseudomonadota bacterium]